MKRRHMREGFTLIELLIVLAIIGALMAIGVPIYTGAIENAKATTVAANIRMIADGVRTKILLEGVDSISANPSVSDYVQLKDTANYEISVATETGLATVTVTYTGGDVDAQKILDKLEGCKEKDKDTNNHPYCLIEVPTTF